MFRYTTLIENVFDGKWHPIRGICVINFQHQCILTMKKAKFLPLLLTLNIKYYEKTV